MVGNSLATTSKGVKLTDDASLLLSYSRDKLNYFAFGESSNVYQTSDDRIEVTRQKDPKEAIFDCS